MSKSLSVVSVIEKNRLSSDVPFLACLDIEVVDPSTGSVVETLYVVHNTEPITFNGNVYEPGSFDISLKAESGQQTSVTLTVRDFSRGIQARMQEHGGGIGFNVTITVVNAANLSQGPEVVEYFEVVGATAANYVATFTLGAENTVSKVFPARKQTRDYCQWLYKDPDTCKYAGSITTCDLSLDGPNGCRAHSNTINFGGFPGINTRNVNHA